MKEDLEKVRLLARDLRDNIDFPRSPRETLAGYVLAARTLDKCRASLVGLLGDYHANCPVDQRWLRFDEISYDEFSNYVATGATDEEVAVWIDEHAKQRPLEEIVVWNNQLRDMRISELPVETQMYLEDYIERYIPRNRVVYRWFDVYDLEEQRL